MQSWQLQIPTESSALIMVVTIICMELPADALSHGHVEMALSKALLSNPAATLVRQKQHNG